MKNKKSLLLCIVVSTFFAFVGEASSTTYELDLYERVSLEFPMQEITITGDNLTIGKCTIKLSESMEDDDIHSDVKHFIATKCIVK